MVIPVWVANIRAHFHGALREKVPGNLDHAALLKEKKVNIADKKKMSIAERLRTMEALWDSLL